MFHLKLTIMKREKVKELMNELIERDFTIDEIANLMSDVKDYLSALKESQREEEDEDYREFHAMTVPRYRKWLQDTLDAMGLEYTIEDFEGEKMSIITKCVIFEEE